MKTREAILTGPRTIEFRERELEVSEDDVLIRVEACGICMWETQHIYMPDIRRYPVNIGHEASGIVECVGKGVIGFKKGEHVTGLFNGGFATYTIADPKYLVKVPEDIPFEYALGEPLKCIVTVAEAISPKVGDYVLVIGCGMMGLMTISILNSRSIFAIAVDIVQEKLILAKEMGAVASVNAKEIDPLEAILHLTNGRGVDIAVEASGTQQGYDLALDSVKKGRGEVIILSYPSDNYNLDIRKLCDKGLIVKAPHPAFSLNQMEDMQKAIECLKRGAFKMDNVITHRYPLDDLQQAFEDAINKPPSYIKGVVKPHWQKENKI
jgi:threonine dehydrogenase-like Zn-dependent dehydrogenase